MSNLHHSRLVKKKTNQLLESLGNETLILGSSIKSFRGLIFYSSGGVCLYISKLPKSVTCNFLSLEDQAYF